MDIHTKSSFSGATFPLAFPLRTLKGDGASRTREQSVFRRPQTSQWATACSFAVPDLIVGLLLLGIFGPWTGIAHALGLTMPPLLPALGILAACFAGAGLYHRAIAMHPIQEIRTAGIMTSVVFLVYGLTLWVAGSIGPNAFLGLSVTGGVAVSLIAVSRALSRVLFAKTDWWGASALVIASESAGRSVVKNLQRWPEMGLRPTAVLQEQSHDDGFRVEALGEENSVPVLHGSDDLATHLMTAYDIPYVIVSRPNLPHQALTNLLRRCGRFCRQVLVLPDLVETTTLWTGKQAFSGYQGYGVRHTDYNQVAQFGKRLFDVVGALLGLILLAPVFLTIAVIAKMESAGPVFFRQLRIGRRGRCFNISKFRSMYADADERLEALLQEDPSLRAEYEKYHKLRDDPRVTRLGAILRRFSLDELPQLWNVLKGDMSLIGPRAYTPDELSDMKDLDRVILQCRPGLSGLWQVSGRNELSFEERTRLDVHYVHHWSLWLDLYILARTVPIVCTQDGVS